MSVGVVFDTSGSMGNKLQRSRQAVAEFMKSANPEDEFLLVQFNDQAGADGALHARHRGDPEPADVRAVQGPDRAAGRRLHGHERDEEGAQSRARRS